MQKYNGEFKQFVNNGLSIEVAAEKNISKCCAKPSLSKATPNLVMQ